MVNFIQKLIKKRNKLGSDPIPAGDKSIKDNKSKKSGKLFSGLRTKFRSGLSNRLGKSSVKGEEILGVEITSKEIRLAQVSSNKANQWILEKFFVHPVNLPDESSVLENADKFADELTIALEKSKIKTANAAIAIPVTSAIIRVVTSPLMTDEELHKAIETNSLWENLVAVSYTHLTLPTICSV